MSDLRRQEPTGDFEDPLAAAIWRARAEADPLPRGDWPDLGMDRAQAVADGLYAMLKATGVRRLGGKAAATDSAARTFLGASEPLVAPLYETTVIQVGDDISVEELVSPLLEAEIGMRRTAAGVVAMPCIEIADSRFVGGKPSIEYVAADFGGQGRMLFGEPGDLGDQVTVTVTCDGEQVATGVRAVADAQTIFDLVSETLRLDAGEPVATGTLFPPVPLRQGCWKADFGSLGALMLTVDDGVSGA